MNQHFTLHPWYKHIVWNYLNTLMIKSIQLEISHAAVKLPTWMKCWTDSNSMPYIFSRHGTERRERACKVCAGLIQSDARVDSGGSHPFGFLAIARFLLLPCSSLYMRPAYTSCWFVRRRTETMRWACAPFCPPERRWGDGRKKSRHIEERKNNTHEERRLILDTRRVKWADSCLSFIPL